MKRLMTMTVLMVFVVVMGAATKASARTGAWHFYDGGYHWVDYGRSYGRYLSRPVVQVGVGYGSYGYDYSYSRGPAGYPDRSLLDFLTGETDRKALEITEKDQDFQQEQERRAEDKEILARAAQRGRDQKIADENQALKKKVDELEKTSQLTKTQQVEEENKKLKERISELEKKIDQLLTAKSGK